MFRIPFFTRYSLGYGGGQLSFCQSFGFFTLRRLHLWSHPDDFNGNAWTHGRPVPDRVPTSSLYLSSPLLETVPFISQKPSSINVLADQLKRDFPMASEVYVKPDRMTVWEPVSQVLAALNAAKPPIQVRFPVAPGRPNQLPEIEK